MRVKMKKPVTTTTVLRKFWHRTRARQVPHTLDNLAQILGASQDEVRDILRELSLAGFVVSKAPAYHEARIWDATQKGADAAKRLAEADRA